MSSVSGPGREKVALITGVRRIGSEIAKNLLERGYHLSVIYRSSEEEAQKLEEFGRRSGRKVLLIKGDLSEEAFCLEAVRRTLKDLGRVDAFVHLASPYFRTPVETLSEEEIQDHFKPIAQAFLILSKEIYKGMLSNEGEIKGRIVAFGDWAADHTPYRDFAAYFVAKGALHTAVKVLAKEFAPHVLVNCIALGPVIKPWDMEEEMWKRILRNTPLKREVPIRDITNLVIYLLEVEGITGEIIRVDSGRHIAGSGTGTVA